MSVHTGQWVQIPFLAVFRALILLSFGEYVSQDFWYSPLYLIRFRP